MLKTLLIVLAVIVIGAAGVIGYMRFTKKSATTQTVATTTTTVAPVSTTATGGSTAGTLLESDVVSAGDITEHYNLAKDKAIAWQKDAVLYHLAIKIPGALLPKTATETYTFGSPTDPKNWYTVAIAQDSNKYIRAIIPKEDYLNAGAYVNLGPANTPYWKTTWVKALQVADVNGGSAFRAANTLQSITINLYSGAPKGYLWYVAEYRAADDQIISFRVNPVDGTAVDEAGNPISTLSTTATPSASGTAPTTSSTTPTPAGTGIIFGP